MPRPHYLLIPPNSPSLQQWTTSSPTFPPTPGANSPLASPNLSNPSSSMSAFLQTANKRKGRTKLIVTLVSLVGVGLLMIVVGERWTGIRKQLEGLKLERVGEKLVDVKEWGGKKLEDGLKWLPGGGNDDDIEEEVRSTLKVVESPTSPNLLPSATASTRPSAIKITALPPPQTIVQDPNTKYIGFLPHSGFHNQRGALQNALMLGRLLNRTVLIPPVWIGWPTPTQFYDELARTWSNLILLNPSAFDLPESTTTADSPLYNPINFPSTRDSLVRTKAELAASSRHAIDLAKHVNQTTTFYKSLGWEIRPDGYPISNWTEADCKSYRPECRWTYKDTFLSWSFLGDLEKIKQEAKVIDRWDVREGSLMELLGVEPEDVYVFKDERTYDFQFTECSGPLITAGEGRWGHTVSLSALAKLDHRVILFGSLFGSGRISAQSLEIERLAQFFEESLAFRTPWLLTPARAIRDRLGGRDGYVGVHARVGDGTFMKNAEGNMEVIWRRLMARLRLEKEVEDALWERVGFSERIVSEAGKVKRDIARVEEEEVSTWSLLDGEEEFEQARSIVTHKSASGFQKFYSPAHIKRAPVPTTFARPPLVNLTCRSPLHTDPNLVALNVPLYLATDSRSPTTSPHLAIFFKTFPCTFILSDFDRPSELNGGDIVESVGEMMRLKNGKDGVGLGRLFLPFLEAVVASMGEITVGTKGSTFSAFAEDGLHKAYRSDSEGETSVMTILED